MQICDMIISMNNNKSIQILIGVAFLALVVFVILRFGNINGNKEVVDNISQVQNSEISQDVPQNDSNTPVAENDKVIDLKKEVIDTPIPVKENILKINFKGDFTSSGAQRNYEAIMIFKDGILINGSESYFVGQGGGCTLNCDRTDSCKISNQKWVDSTSGGECKIDQYIPLSLEEINQKINNKEIKPKSECGRFDICYEITSS